MLGWENPPKKTYANISINQIVFQKYRVLISDLHSENRAKFQFSLKIYLRLIYRLIEYLMILRSS